MGLREDMAAVCRAARERIEKENSNELCGGEVVITDAHRQEANNDVQELLMLATQGCRSGCRCLKAAARIEERNGVQVVIASCNHDPRLVPLTHHAGR